MVTDKRYRSMRWRRTRLIVLARDGYRCYVKGCSRLGNQCDHIQPVTPDLPDDLFYGESNLRASCKFHNVARGWRDKLDREEREGADPVGVVQAPVLLMGGACTASTAGIRGRRRDGTMVYGVIPQFDGSTYASTNCGACSEAARVVSQRKGIRPSRGTPWPPTGASIRRETGDTSGGLNPSQTTRASYNEYGVPYASPRIASKQAILDKLRDGYAVDLLVAYGPIDDYLSGSPGFRGNHRGLLTARNSDTRKLRWSDSLYDGRRAGIPLGQKWIPQSVIFDAASRLDLGGGVSVSERYGYDDAYYIPSLTRLDQHKYRAVVPSGKYGAYYVVNGAIKHRTMYSTGGFSADCTAPQTYPVSDGANVPGGSFRLVQLTSGAHKGRYINAKFAHEVEP